MQNVYFLHQIRRTNNDYNKGIVVKDLSRKDGETDSELSKRNYEAALQGYHAFLGAFAYGQSAETDFVSCEITDAYGVLLTDETWIAPEAVPAPEAE